MKLIDKDAVVADIERRIKINKECMLGLKNLDYYQGKVDALNDALSLLDTIEVKEMDLTNRKSKWSPNKKQMESLKDMLRYNIGVFDYQKFMEVNSLYDDLTKILDYETDRQK
jgi:hypothetical protein